MGCAGVRHVDVCVRGESARVNESCLRVSGGKSSACAGEPWLCPAPLRRRGARAGIERPWLLSRGLGACLGAKERNV